MVFQSLRERSVVTLVSLCLRDAKEIVFFFLSISASQCTKLMTNSNTSIHQTLCGARCKMFEGIAANDLLA